MNRHDLDEILTLNTIPSILNRDTQGRLRKKMVVVLKIEKWIARFLPQLLGRNSSRFDGDFYSVDMSSKNPRWLQPRQSGFTCIMGFKCTEILIAEHQIVLRIASDFIVQFSSDTSIRDAAKPAIVCPPKY